MQHDLMADGHIAFDNQRIAFVSMKDREILNVAALANGNCFGITAHNSPKPDARVFFQNHIAKHGCAIGHIEFIAARSR